MKGRGAFAALNSHGTRDNLGAGREKVDRSCHPLRFVSRKVGGDTSEVIDR